MALARHGAVQWVARDSRIEALQHMLFDKVLIETSAEAWRFKIHDAAI